MDSLLAPPLEMINHYSSKHNLDQDEDALFANQILDIVFTSHRNEKLGFGVRIDENKKYLQINSINFEGEARRVGLKQGDIILAVNDVDIGSKPQIGIEELKKCKAINETEEEQEIRITVCRRVFDHIMVTISRSGISKCDGKYTFIHLDEDYDSPIFMNQDNDMLLLKANYDLATGESLWSISDQQNNYYIGVSSDLMPPNDSWEPIKNVGKYPSPGLVFYNTDQRLIEIEDDKSSEDEDEFINVNYENIASSTQKRMSRIGLNALKDPSSINHPFVVYEHMNEYEDDDGEDSGYVSFQSQTSDDSSHRNANDRELETKYNQLLAQYDESQEMIQILRQNVKELNASFYEFWLKDKKKEEEKDRLKRRINEQNKELFQQNKVEMKFINKLNDTQAVNGRKQKKVNSLCEVDLEALLAINNNIDLEVDEGQNMVCINSEMQPLHEKINHIVDRVRHKTKDDKICSLYDIDVDLIFASDETITHHLEIEETVNEICVKREVETNELQEEIHGLNERISVLYDAHLDLLFDENEQNAVDADEISKLKQQIQELEDENQHIYALKKEIHVLKEENMEMCLLHHEIHQLKQEQIDDLKNEIADLRGKYKKIHKLNDEIHALKDNYMKLKKEKNLKHARNNELVKQVNDLMQENDAIIASKLQLIHKTADEILRLKNVIRCISRQQN